MFILVLSSVVKGLFFIDFHIFILVSFGLLFRWLEVGVSVIYILDGWDGTGYTLSFFDGLGCERQERSNHPISLSHKLFIPINALSMKSI